MKNKRILLYFSLILTVLLLSGCSGASALDVSDTNSRSAAAQGSAAPEAALITEDEVKAAAYDHAGIAAEDVSFVKTNLDYEHGRTIYEVDFYSGNMEYDYEIDASTGEILSWDHDAEYDLRQNPGSGTSENYIGEAGAKEKALAEAGLSESDISHLSVKFDHEHGRAEYEVEFYSGRTEYNYEIDAATGEIISSEIDHD